MLRLPVCCEEMFICKTSPFLYRHLLESQSENHIGEKKRSFEPARCFRPPSPLLRALRPKAGPSLVIRIHVGTALAQHFLRTNPVSTAYSNAACIKYSRAIRINTVSAAVRIWRWMRTFLTAGFYRMLQYGGSEWLPSTMSWITYSLSITAAEIGGWAPGAGSLGSIPGGSGKRAGG